MTRRPLSTLPFLTLARVPLLAGLLCLGSAALGADTAEAELAELQALVDQDRYQEAYALSQQLLREWEGDPAFDFLYGTAALETGHSNEAVFAFERLVVAFPDQGRLKLELARAFYEQNNLSASRELFEEVLATDPTPTVRNNIQVFLAAIEERENSIAPTLRWYVASMVGGDSNINSATELGVISTPIGDVELNPSGQGIDDTFLEGTVGMNYVHPLSKTSALTLSGTYNKHNNIDTSDFDLDVFSLEGGYNHTVGGLRLSYGARAQRVNLATEPFQNSTSLIATVQRSPGNGWSQAATIAYSGVRFDTGLAANANLRDVNQVLLSGTVGRTAGRFSHAASVYYGDESARRDLGRNNAQQFYGIAFTEQFAFRQGHIPYVRVSFHHSENKAPAPIFNVIREDDLFSTSVGWVWSATSNFNVTTDVTYTDNESNLPLFTYDRLKYQTGLRYQF